MGWATGVRFSAKDVDFLYSSASGSELNSTQPHTQSLRAFVEMGLKRPERETDHHTPPSAEVKACGAILLLPAVCLHCIVLNDISTETNLHYIYIYIFEKKILITF